MKIFAQALEKYLAGPPRVVQAAFADRTGINKSKLSRILSATTPVDRPTLDAILSGVVQANQRSALVAAHIQDLISPVALSYLKGQASNPWTNVEVPQISRKALAALKGLAQSNALPQLERHLIDLATVAGIKL
jgi:hypothetical protein